MKLKRFLVLIAINVAFPPLFVMAYVTNRLYRVYNRGLAFAYGVEL